ncbi:uncharacterized protein THITE_2113699 [Thermothielavioides terrestris NRRL 8126]|uniref:Uncharacterized protein n=1 Tax=Thermothielavioides terrestris (strain ATCC 38088 / NRRL 8126) TaxID=578455 RepID=G2R3T9_THETT|nr:uncharacterized protein THITE_2113699 [Thermothielavioides terrestris NRRL 8126]AEO65994.1 hypothetical protein THITE_2113699 [Thermothielavioides terrestris NRRL 8126]
MRDLAHLWPCVGSASGAIWLLRVADAFDSDFKSRGVINHTKLPSDTQEPNASYNAG